LISVDRLAIDDLGRAPAGKLLRHVGGAGNVVLMACDQHAILGGHQIGLDEIHAEIDGKVVGRERVLGPMAGCTAMPDDERRAAAQGWRKGRHGLSLCGGSERNNQCAIEHGRRHPLEKTCHGCSPRWLFRSAHHRTKPVKGLLKRRVGI
jgi:hypothetical protein